MAFYQTGVSRLVMKAFGKHGHNTVIWNSPIDQNKWADQKIIDGMIFRFKKQQAYKFTNVMIWYENEIEIYRQRPS
jgi:hypothetical protein